MSYDNDELSRMEKIFASDDAVDKEISSPRVVHTDEDYLHLEDIVVHDADGMICESYKHLKIQKWIDLDSEKANIVPTLGMSINRLEEKGLHLPSMALTGVILKTVFEQFQERTLDDDYAWHKETPLDIAMSDFISAYTVTPNYYMTNTLVNWDQNYIVHYPTDTEIPETGKFNQDRNSYLRKFDGSMRKQLSYQDNLAAYKTKHFFQELMGTSEVEVFHFMAKEYEMSIWNRFTPAQQTMLEPFGMAYIGPMQDSKIFLGTGRTSRFVLRGVGGIE